VTGSASLSLSRESDKLGRGVIKDRGENERRRGREREIIGNAARFPSPTQALELWIAHASTDPPNETEGVLFDWAPL
jgi:hypothetical protein